MLDQPLLIWSHYGIQTRTKCTSGSRTVYTFSYSIENKDLDRIDYSPKASQPFDRRLPRRMPEIVKLKKSDLLVTRDHAIFAFRNREVLGQDRRPRIAAAASQARGSPFLRTGPYKAANRTGDCIQRPQAGIPEPRRWTQGEERT